MASRNEPVSPAIGRPSASWRRQARDLLALAPESHDLLRIDLMRFIASAAILFMHLIFYWKPRPDWLVEASHGFRLFVDLFFVISGLVITSYYKQKILTPGGYRVFLRRRVARLLPLHWLTLSFFVALYLASRATGIPLNDPDRYAMSCLVPNLLMVHAAWTCDRLTFNYVSWSISAEMMLYAAAPLFLWLTRWTRSWTAVLALGIVAVMVAIDPGWSERTFNGGILRAIPSFLFGVGLFEARGQLARLPSLAGVLPVLYLAMFGAALAELNPAILLVIAYLLVTVAYAADLRAPPGPLVSRAAGLGQLTYSLYMWHPVMATAAIAILADKLLRLNGGLSNLWLIVVGVVVLPLISTLSLKLFETPARRMLAGGRAPPVSIAGAP